ncbi:MAG: MFS transporter [Rhodobacteraceae bacterium]|jgi:MFS family permease|nr:MFS transporter [Paracoccaceae bacterium]
MIKAFTNSWALLLGMLLLMIGNGMQGTLLGVRGGIEGFSAFQMSFVMSAYFLGFLGGSRLTPEMIRRVGHVRVFAALGSLISAILILYAAVPDWIAWTGMRVLMGFCFSGVYVTAESWLNNSATNETRGQTLSAYMIVQMLGIITAQGLMNVGDAGGYFLFVIPSVLVSVAFTPILLAISPAPVFGSTKPMTIRQLFHISPLGCVGMFLAGGVFSAMFGMSSVYGTEAGLSVAQISMFIGAMYGGGLVFQYPIGFCSDRMDRRKLILGLSAIGAVATLVGFAITPGFTMLLVLGVAIGGVTNPLYSLLIAYTNDYLQADDMAAASGGLMFINGLGAVSGPMVTAWMMGVVGPGGFFLFIMVLMVLLAAYSGWRMTRRAATPMSETGAYTAILPTTSAVAVEAVIEASQEADSSGDAAAATN